jgi:hypothetical protein
MELFPGFFLLESIGQATVVPGCACVLERRKQDRLVAVLTGVPSVPHTCTPTINVDFARDGLAVQLTDNIILSACACPSPGSVRHVLCSRNATVLDNGVVQFEHSGPAHRPIAVCLAAPVVPAAKPRRRCVVQ